jgi:hypothetical protein
MSPVGAIGRRVGATWMVAVLTLVATALAGCGDDDATASAPTVAGSIVGEVNEACRAQRAAYDERPDFPIEGFDPTYPDPEVLPEVGAYFEGSNSVYEEFIARLEAIDAPPEEREELAAYLETSRSDFELAKEQQVAAKAKDVDAFVATLDRVIATTEQLNDQARALGAKDCVGG